MGRTYPFYDTQRDTNRFRSPWNLYVSKCNVLQMNMITTQLCLDMMSEPLMKNMAFEEHDLINFHLPSYWTSIIIIVVQIPAFIIPFITLERSAPDSQYAMPCGY